MLNPNKYQNYRKIPMTRQVQILCDIVCANHIDLTNTYEKWRNIGYALALEFQSNGIDFFLTLSSNHPDFNDATCRKMYESLLNGTPPVNPITIHTLFKYAHDADIIVPAAEEVTEPLVPPTPRELPEEQVLQYREEGNELKTIPQDVKDSLPKFLKRTFEHTDYVPEQDMIILGAMSILSSCMENVFMYYDKTRLYPNMYTFIIGGPSSGKGRVGICEKLIEPIHARMKDEYNKKKLKYEEDKLAYNTERHKNKEAIPPTEPNQTMKIIPANSTFTAVVETLAHNPSGLAIAITEGDVLVNVFKNDVSNYDVILRMVFHNEHVSYLRRTNKEWVECDCPKLSMLVGSYPEQVIKICPSTDNGLFSRFMFYHIPNNLVWRNNFSDDDNPDEVFDLNDKFYKLGQEYLIFYDRLIGNTAFPQYFVVRYSKEQQARFNEFFQHLMDKYYSIFGDPVIGTIHRLGVSFLRITEVLSTLRCMETDLPIETYSNFKGNGTAYSLYCTETDFHSAMEIVDVIVRHDAKVLISLMEGERAERLKSLTSRQLDLYGMLPKEFTYDDLNPIATQLGININSVQKRLARILEKGFIKFENNKYYKL